MAIVEPQLRMHCIDPVRSKKVLFHRYYTTRSVSFSFTSKFQSSAQTKPILRSEFSRNESSGHVFTEHGELMKQYVDDKLFEDAVMVYLKMLKDGYAVNEFRFFPCLIKAYGGFLDEQRIKEIHGHVLKLGFLDDIYVANSLLGVYWKCGADKNAYLLFNKMSERDSISWNTMISGFSQTGDYMSSLLTFSQMIWEENGFYPKRVACLSALSSCSYIEYLLHGKEIHGFLVKKEMDIDEFLVSGLIEMYMKCGDVRMAENVFNGFLNRDTSKENTVIWNVIISGYVSNGYLFQAFDLFLDMISMGIAPDSSTMVAALVLCSHLLDLPVSKQVHGFILKCFGLTDNVQIETALIDAYFKSGDSESSWKIFRMSQNRNLIMWTTMISNFTQNHCSSSIQVLDLLGEYLNDHGIIDQVILLALLRVCSSLMLKSLGKEIHGLTVKMGFDSDKFISGALVDMYAKCTDMGSAKIAFFRPSTRDLILWNALIRGYAQNEYPSKALNAFRAMQMEENVRPDNVTISCVLSACSQLSVLNSCKEAHGYLTRQGISILESNSLISTYAKCGDVNSSWKIFTQMLEKNEISWNSILFALGMHGKVEDMFNIFKKMKVEEGIRPDHTTFTTLLSACSHSGKLDIARDYLKTMIFDYNLEPKLEHYTCMVDLLGRAGHLTEAYDLILSMPCEPDVKIWGSLLGSCKSYGDEELAEIVGDRIFALDRSSIGYRVLLGNMYREFGKLDEFRRVRMEIKDKGLVKSPGCSWVEIDNNVHVFIAGDNSHSKSAEIYSALESLTAEINRYKSLPNCP